MSQLRSFLARFPRLNAALKTVAAPFRTTSVSTNYSELSASDVATETMRLRGAWQASELPARQRKLVDQQLNAFKRGEAVNVFDVMLESIANVNPERSGSILEVGCSSGYYSEVIARSRPDLSYVGCDYSSAFIDMAKALYPSLRFDVEDACALRYPDASFDTVISGCCLLHIPEYIAAVAETARVASRAAIFHRTPVVIGQPQTIYRKMAYDVETVEIHFNESEFLMLLRSNGFNVIGTHTLSEVISAGVGTATRTYVCEKVAV